MKKYQLSYSLYITVDASDKDEATQIGNEIAFNADPADGRAAVDYDSPDTVEEMQFCHQCEAWVVLVGEECPICDALPLLEEQSRATYDLEI